MATMSTEAMMVSIPRLFLKSRRNGKSLTFVY